VKLEQRSAVVTGAAGGIGLATARRLLRDGASVLLADLNQDKLAAAAALAFLAGDDARFICGAGLRVDGGRLVRL
jgi:NAD(P)-dependent dehydrogenase (short-subunit alcohol dehydrogenase family)